jgi:hypothetical protein
MVDFDAMKDKAQQAAEEHPDQVSNAMDKASGAAGERFGHEEQIDKGAQKAEDYLTGGGQEGGEDQGGQDQGGA